MSDSSFEEISTKMNKARKAFKLWSSMRFAKRRNLLFSLKGIIYKERYTVADILMKEGSRVRFSAEGLIFEVLNTFFIVKEAENIVNRKDFIHLNKLFYPGKKCYISYEPIGVIGIISPSTSPFFESFQQIVQAVIMGNTAVVKLPPDFPLLTKKIQAMIASSALPDGVVNIVSGGADLGEYMVSSPDIDKISAFGRRATGEKIIKASASTIKPLLLGLGDSGFAIVLGDNNQEKTADGIIYGAFCNSGQTCSCIRRVIAVNKVADKLLDALVKRVRKIQLNAISDMEEELGTINKKEDVDRFFEALAEAKTLGAKVITGAESNPANNKMVPVIISNVNKDMKIAQNEFMVPYICFMKAKDISQAVEIANSSIYGLSASIWTSDIVKAKEIAAQLKAGIIWINDTQFYHYRFPFGGLKQSGYGKVSGAAALREYVDMKLICIDRNKKSNFHWFPYNKKKISIMRSMLSLKHSPNKLGKIKYFLNLFFNNK